MINKDGYGVFKCPDGRMYQGEWFNGRFHGKGQYTNLKGEVIEGTWKHGKLKNKSKNNKIDINSKTLSEYPRLDSNNG